ncbi:ribonuclease E activity regulator RraA [Pseudomonas sp. 21LCFQ010]|uniref:ribonuclease E activity regulator RraA n=1 Tax=Pseudomonas sp. 21LCFQ010 TaxID=2957506 RepID=UPI002096C5F3|nr:ribonuclease E activity regulator RraA [Pseudomonas sp. 21LCFQ010]MCO8165437.1 ribonuclease E activity regulator RraA [Pseudomonas sp. 21LCFQ010]
MNTTEICDLLKERAQFLPPRFTNFGGRHQFRGEAVTIKCYEDSSRIKEAIATDGRGKVLVVDAGGSERCAVFGDMSAQTAIDNGWEGIVINGCLRDVRRIAAMDIGVRALGAVPKGSNRQGQGLCGIAVTLAHITVQPGDLIVADEDGLLVLTASDVSLIA